MHRHEGTRCCAVHPPGPPAVDSKKCVQADCPADRYTAPGQLPTKEDEQKEVPATARWASVAVLLALSLVGVAVAGLLLARAWGMSPLLGASGRKAAAEEQAKHLKRLASLVSPLTLTFGGATPSCGARACILLQRAACTRPGPHTALPLAQHATEPRRPSPAARPGSPACPQATRSHAGHSRMSVAFSGLRLTLGGRALLDGAWGHLKAGRLIAVMGPSGAGKSTLLK